VCAREASPLVDSRSGEVERRGFDSSGVKKVAMMRARARLLLLSVREVIVCVSRARLGRVG
jgi:hypothetical protein